MSTKVMIPKHFQFHTYESLSDNCTLVVAPSSPAALRRETVCRSIVDVLKSKAKRQ